MVKAKPFDPVAEIENICTWIKNYFIDNGPNSKAVIGISGGLDSTLALLVTVEAMRRLGKPASDVYGVTMPCFGTSDRTYQNSWELMRKLGINCKEISIRDAKPARSFSSESEAYVIISLSLARVIATYKTRISSDKLSRLILSAIAAFAMEG